MKDSGIKQAVIRVLRAEPGLTARQLASRLRAEGFESDKSRVNSILYRHNSDFRCDDSVPPCWYAGGATPDGPTPATYAATSLSLSNWKAFESTDIGFAGINLVFGENSSGKSSLFQALLILKQSWGRGWLDIDGTHSFGLIDFDIENVIHRYRTDEPLVIGTEWNLDTGARGGHALRVTTRVPPHDPGNHWIERITLVGETTDLTFFRQEDRRDVPPGAGWSWAVFISEGGLRADPAAEIMLGTAVLLGCDEHGFPDVSDRYTFPDTDAFPPSELDGAIEPALAEIARVLEALVHIGPQRPMPPRRAPIGPGHPEFGYLRRLAEQPELLADVNDWLGRFEIPYQLSTVAVHSEDAVILELLMPDGEGDHTLELQLQDVGFGISQLLPIVVQLLGNRDTTILIEEPEAHVHPRLQGILGDLLVTSAQDHRNVLIVETHSEPLLLRLQRRIAEKRVAHDAVRAFHVIRNGEASTVHDVPIRPDGQLDYQWPGGFFDDRMDDLIAILDPRPLD